MDSGMVTITRRIGAWAWPLVLIVAAGVVPAQAEIEWTPENWSPEAELAEIRKQIDENGWDWEAGLTPASYIPPWERDTFLGVEPLSEEELISRATGVLDAPARDFPTYWDWRTMGGTTPAKNQLTCGSCWAFGAVGALESLYKITTGVQRLFSEQQCISCNAYGDGCDGGQQTSCYILWMGFGAVESSCMPYHNNDTTPCTQDECDVPARLTDFTHVGATVEYLKTVVMEHAVAVYIYANGAFMNYHSGCFVGPLETPNHVVLLCGWDDDACSGNGGWLIKNSWGTGWGMSGFGWIQWYSTGCCGGANLLYLALPPEANNAYRSNTVLDGVNGALDPGETAMVSVEIGNYGFATATGVTATLAALTPGVTVVDDEASYTDVPSWGTRTSIAPHFTVSVASDVERGSVMQFELTVVCDQSTDVSEMFAFVGTVDEVYANDFDGSTAGWNHGSMAGVDDWQVATPRDLFNHRDPRMAFSGAQVFGNDLNTDVYTWDGIYPSNVHNYLQSPVINCSGQTGVHLLLSRWLTVEESIYDVANILVNGTEIWRNQYSGDHLDEVWVPTVFDISEYADDNSSVVVRFELESDSGLEYGGWTLDDFQIVATNLTGASVEAEDGMPRALALESHPNPFGAGTKLSLAVPVEDPATSLRIFDAAGRLVRTVHQGALRAGVHQFDWNGLDQEGQPVPAGTYYCRAQSLGNSVVTKLLRLQ